MGFSVLLKYPRATFESIADDMRALPSRTTYDDRYYIGFFMIDKEYQGRGVGKTIVEITLHSPFFIENPVHIW